MCLQFAPDTFCEDTNQFTKATVANCNCDSERGFQDHTKYDTEKSHHDS